MRSNGASIVLYVPSIYLSHFLVPQTPNPSLCGAADADPPPLVGSANADPPHTLCGSAIADPLDLRWKTPEQQ